ncbi:hypothetical protein [Alkalicoccobacillus plakortidis]|uniref:Uncharacterized protein n=1 Tax=Alkalicoccobacillus plakortidis TaxID=444060 RepID=A0ABT0XI64_9BACI|nr:hypothetical protein [Alkalicoccobacillus plakortidis]MCM2675605.1 hypothetical protein [Alkalicoccobacillus plakortidis]
MKQEQLFQLAALFLNLEHSMTQKGRPNIAAYARKKHERYYQQFLATV